MTPRQIIRAMNDIHGEAFAPNYRADDAAELAQLGLMELRHGAWAIASEGRKFIREYHKEHFE